jgi:predicted alpha/beta hydrolase family esterase
MLQADPSGADKISKCPIDPTSFRCFILASNTDEGVKLTISFTLTQNFKSDFIDAHLGLTPWKINSFH